MAFTSITSTDIESGDPVSQELWNLVKTNEDDLNARVSTLETSLNVFPPIEFQFIGTHWKGSANGLSYYRVSFAITLTSARLYIPSDGDSGTTTVDIQKSSTGGGSFSSIFSVKPTLAQGGGNHSENQGTLSTTSLVAGDLLRADLNSVQENADVFYLYLSYEAT